MDIAVFREFLILEKSLSPRLLSKGIGPGVEIQRVKKNHKETEKTNENIEFCQKVHKEGCFQLVKTKERKSNQISLKKTCKEKTPARAL